MNRLERCIAYHPRKTAIVLMLAALALGLLLGAIAAHAQPCPPGDTSCIEATAEAGEATDAEDDGAATAAPASLTDWMRTHVAAAAYCPVRAGKKTTPMPAEGEKPTEEPGCAVGAAVRVTPDKWLPWAAGPFLSAKDVGPWVGYVLYRGAGGSAGLGIGYRLRMDNGIELRRGAVVVGATLSLAGARGGAK